MKRVNVHLDSDTPENLDKILKKISDDSGYRYREAKRADLIRFAIGEVFGFKTSYAYRLREDLEKLKIIKKAKK